MADSLYITAIEADCGEITVVLGVMETLLRRIRKVGFFRPVILTDDPPDNDIQLVLSRYNPQLPYAATYGCTRDQARNLIARGRHDELLTLVVDRYRQLESQCGFVLCQGTDYTGGSSSLEFDFNAEMASNLGAPVLAVVNGRGKSPERLADVVRVARDAFAERNCTVLATCINRLAPEEMAAVAAACATGRAVSEPVFLLPREPGLEKPTVGDILRALDARLLNGDPEGLARVALDFKVAAMQLPLFLEQITEGVLVITPGDRADIQLASLAAPFFPNCPTVAGLVITGGVEPPPQVMGLLARLPRPSLPVLSVTEDTFATAVKIQNVHPVIAAGNDRRIALALGLFEAHVDTRALEELIVRSRSETVTPTMFQHQLIEWAKAGVRHIVLAEGTEERILRAAEILLRRKVCALTLLGDATEIERRASALGLDLAGAEYVDPARSPWLEGFSETFFTLRRDKGVTVETARDTMLDPSYFATMMVFAGYADGMVSGAAHSTADTIRPGLQIIKTGPGCATVSSVFLMCLPDRVLVYGDCAINPDPDAAQLADIAISSAETARNFGIEPLVAMCSYSSGSSGSGRNVDKVRQATEKVRRDRPDLQIEGPIQYDAAIDAEVARTKMPDSAVAGRATVFIFPDLNTGNNLYKAVQRSAGAVAIGPVLQGLRKPVNDLSRGCTVTDIVNTVAVTAIMAQSSR